MRISMRTHRLASQLGRCHDGLVPISASASLGATLRRLRSERSMTVETLAERSGVSNRTIVYIEAGGANPRLDIVEAIAQALGIPVSDLLSAERAAS
jgi:transcriptional regulator with XRE-family HTH domain